MFRKMNGQRGQALILITFAMIALIAMVGLAVDGSMAFSDRRHAQNAADTAALAGAMTKVYGHEQKLSNGVIYSNLVLCRNGYGSTERLQQRSGFQYSGSLHL
jgi:Flp pilus assembly protein TadG